MTTTYRIGSLWLGQPSESIEQLIDTLGRTPLDPRFEEYDPEPFIDRSEISPAVRFFGNFLRLSYAFSVTTDDPETIERLTAAIRANRAGAEYSADLAVRVAARASLANVCDCAGCQRSEASCVCALGCCPCAGEPVRA